MWTAHHAQHVSNEKKPCLFREHLGIILPSYVGIFSQTIRIPIKQPVFLGICGPWLFWWLMLCLFLLLTKRGLMVQPWLPWRYSKWGAYTPHHSVGDISQQECPEKSLLDGDDFLLLFFLCWPSIVLLWKNRWCIYIYISIYIHINMLKGTSDIENIRCSSACTWLPHLTSQRN